MTIPTFPPLTFPYPAVARHWCAAARIGTHSPPYLHDVVMGHFHTPVPEGQCVHATTVRDPIQQLVPALCARETALDAEIDALAIGVGTHLYLPRRVSRYRRHRALSTVTVPNVHIKRSIEKTHHIQWKSEGITART